MALKTYKYRIYPTEGQQQKMMQFFGCVRVVYNMCLDHYTNEYKRWKKEGGDFEKTPLVTAFKKEKEFLKDCDNAALAYARSNFEKALSDFFKSKKGQRQGKKVGFPKHKKRGKSKFTYRTCDAHGGIRFNEENNTIKLPKIGWVKCKKHREYNGIIKSVTVTMVKSGRFYISVMVETATDKPIVLKKNNITKLNVVGLDMSLQKFCISSDEDDNTIIKYCRNYRKEETKLARLNHRMSLKIKVQKTRKRQE